jgi:predicted metal-dependent HD superfamily phosphohydrolase
MDLYPEDSSIYHNRDHIRNCLSCAQVFLGYDYCKKDWPYGEHAYNVVRFALLFHDIRYWEAKSGHEFLSAILWLDYVYQEKEVPYHFAVDVHDAILETEKHDHYHHSEETSNSFVRDIDLLVGLGWGDYNKFVDISERIRREYFFELSDSEFMNKRLEFLKALLGRDKLFGVYEISAAYETNTRKMLERYINEHSV